MIIEEISGSIYFRPLGGPDGFRPGQEVQGDLHQRDHTTSFHNGHWRAIKERRVGSRWEVVQQITFEAPYHMLIEGDCRHSFKFFGELVPLWMEPMLAVLSPEVAKSFRAEYQNRPGRAWCIYSRSLDDDGIMMPRDAEAFA